MKIHLWIGLPYLEKQKSGQWMATLHETKFMGFSNFFLTKSGRSNSALDIIFEGKDQLLKEKRKGGTPKKKKGHHLFGCTFCDIFRPKTAQNVQPNRS